MSFIYYSNCSTLSIGCYLYDDSNLTIPVTNGYYSDGTNCYETCCGGYILGITGCPPPCPPYGTYLYTTCFFNPGCGSSDTVDVYADGVCGEYYQYLYVCYC